MMALLPLAVPFLPSCFQRALLLLLPLPPPLAAPEHGGVDCGDGGDDDNDVCGGDEGGEGEEEGERENPRCLIPLLGRRAASAALGEFSLC